MQPMDNGLVGIAMTTIRPVFPTTPIKKSLDSCSNWGILSDIEFWSQARFSQSLDLGTFQFRELKTPPAFRERFQVK